MNSIAKLTYRLSLALWIGGMTVLSLIVTPVLFRSFDRDIAGNSVGAILPTYYSFNLGLSVLCFALLLFFFRDKSGKLIKATMAMLTVAIFMNAYVQFGILPQVMEIKAAIPSFEGMSKLDPLRQEFGRLHGFSSALNLLVMIEGFILFGLADKLFKETK